MACECGERLARAERRIEILMRDQEVARRDIVDANRYISMRKNFLNEGNPSPGGIITDVADLKRETAILRDRLDHMGSVTKFEGRLGSLTNGVEEALARGSRAERDADRAHRRLDAHAARMDCLEETLEIDIPQERYTSEPWDSIVLPNGNVLLSRREA